MHYNERIKRQIETKEERCARLEEQTKRAKEEAARKYQEYLKTHPEHVEPELKRPTVITEAQQKSEQRMLAAKQESDVKYEQTQREQFMQTMYGGALIVPPVAASNQRVIAYEQKRRAAKEYAEHYAENRERDVQRSIREADARAKKAFATMSEDELRQYKADMEAIKLGNEQRTQKQIPKAIRERQMSPETYAKHIAKQKEKNKDPEYRARLQQQKKDRHITHGKTTVRPLSPMPTIDGPLKPPCSN